MTTLQITLPDDLASDAAKAGILTPDEIEAMVRDRHCLGGPPPSGAARGRHALRMTLRKRAGEDLLQMMERLHALPGEPMSMDEINAEVKAARRERREAEQRAGA